MFLGRTRNTSIGDMLRGTALLALLLAVLAAAAAIQYGRAAGAGGHTDRVSGRVSFARTTVNITGTKVKVTSTDREFRIRGHKILFVYKDTWPAFDAVVAAVRTGAQVAVRYGTCREIIRATQCLVYEVETPGHGVIASTADVTGNARGRMMLWSGVAGAAALVSMCFFALLARFRRTPRALPGTGA